MGQKLNSITFKCGKCDCLYSDSTIAKTLESECPKCGEWNYSEPTKNLKNRPKERITKMTKLTVAKSRLREKFSGEIISKSIDKAKRWMTKAYGEVNWESLEDECGIYDLLETYCLETEAEPKGMSTFNRESGNKKNRL